MVVGRFVYGINAFADRENEEIDIKWTYKGYDWMLKAASEAHQQEVFDYVMSREAVMPRTAFRYAIEKMPAALRAEAMKR